MGNRFPPWLVVPLSLLAAVAATWVVGMVQEGKTAASTPLLQTVASPGAESPAPVSEYESHGSDTPTPSDEEKHPLFPDFAGKTADGKTFRLADYKGKIVLINFWATWCGPCKMEIPELIALQKKYGAQGFTVVGLSEDAEFASAAAFAKDFDMNYPVMKTPEGLANKIGVSGLPESVLVGKDGKVVTAIVGVDPRKAMSAIWGPQIEKVL